MCVNTYTLAVNEDTVYLNRFQAIRLFKVNMIKLLIVGLMLVISGNVYASKEKSIEQIQQEEWGKKALRLSKNMEDALDVLMDERRTDCQKAIGYSPFCSCILESLPIGWDFSDYVAITTKTKDENGFKEMDKGHQDAYEKVIPIRDKCVIQINSK